MRVIIFFRTVLAIAAFTALSFSARAQNFERNVISPGGRVATGANVQLSYTVGEVFTSGGSSAAASLSGGYQQPSGYDYWSQQNHLTTGPLADPDGDGLVNLLEYALGTDPNNPASRAQVSVSIGPGGKLYLTVTKNPLATGISWGAEGSTDLVLWSAQSVNIALDTATTFAALFTGNAPAAFLRLRIGLAGSS